MARPDERLDAQLLRQKEWLSESWLWILDTKVLPDFREPGRRPAALEVGCGPGHVMDLLSSRLDVQGADLDDRMAGRCRERGLEALRANTSQLPFRSRSFDVVYCSFLLLWLKDPRKAVAEMKRVSRRWVLCLAEPDYGGRIDYPEELRGLRGISIRGMEREGGDPLIGRKLRSILASNGLEAEVGVHPGVWGLERLRAEADAEWRSLERSVHGAEEEAELARMKGPWVRALGSGEAFQYNPVFYALARVD